MNLMLKNVLLGTGIVSVGLMAGLFYGWTVSVIPGLRRVSDHSYITTMQDINRAIINPAFVLVFMGIPVVLGAAAVAQFRAGDGRRAWLLTAAAGTYIVGVLGVTMGGNVPLNNALDGFELSSATADTAAERRHSYETPWVRWHNVRTAANVVSFGLAAAAAVVSEQAD